MTTVQEISQRSVTEPLIALYELDLTDYNLGIARFVSSRSDKDVVRFGGETYAPYPVECTGFEWSGTGQPPTPSLKMSTILPVLRALIIGGNDLIGSKFTRIRTYRRFLNDGAEPNTESVFEYDEFRVERKVTHNKVYAEFELASILDQQGIKLPKRQALRSYCFFIYRKYDAPTMSFIYDEHYPCPYTGPLFFDLQGRDTTARNDRCSKNLSACKKRFGEFNPIPISAFPGMSLVK